jgi:hypothetical protein
VGQIFVDGGEFLIIHSSERTPWHLLAHLVAVGIDACAHGVEAPVARAPAAARMGPSFPPTGSRDGGAKHVVGITMLLGFDEPFGIATQALRCAPHVDRSAEFRLNDRDHPVGGSPALRARRAPYATFLSRVGSPFPAAISSFGIWLVSHPDRTDPGPCG